jgi:hypothetical protein
LLGDPEVVQRRGEIPVGEQECRDGSRRCRHEPADDRHQHHQQEIQQQHAGQVDLAAQAGQGRGRKRQPHQGH